MGSQAIGERIRALRNAKKWPLRELASRTGFTAAYLSMIERGERGTTIETLEQIADAFSISPGLLQDPAVDIGQISEISEILSQVTKLEKEQLHTLQQLLGTFGARESEGEAGSGEASEERPTPNESEVASAIRHFRELKGWSQVELARRVEMDPGQLSRLERGGGRLRLSTLVRFAKAFEIDVSLLLGRNTDESHVFLERLESLSSDKKHRLFQYLDELVRLEALEREKAS